jgi:diketogulonate reductase-like aldo/keto reductase
MMEADERGEVIASLKRGIELGMTHIDTAELYGSGRVEELVGEAIAGQRERVYLASKIIPDNASARKTVSTCERSLRRLRTDYLDLYLLHWVGPHPLGETFEAFERLREAGKIRAYGVSNFDEMKLAECVRLVGAESIACNQVLYHLQERAIEHHVLPFCEEHGIAVVGYSPFGSGDFPSKGSRGGRLLTEIARARAVTERQVALAYLIRRQSLFTIPKASRRQHVEDNAAAAELELTQAELELVEVAFPKGKPRHGVPML